MSVWEALGTIATSFGVCLGASMLPIGGGVEAYLLTTSTLLPTAFVAPLVIASAAGSVAAKTIVFVGATKASSGSTFFEGESRRARLATRITEGPWIRRAVILGSALFSVPPYYALAVAAGALRTPRTEFIVLGMLGQTIRFAAVWAIPQVAGGVFGS